MLEQILEKERPDGVICAGDLTERGAGNVEYAQEFLKLCARHNALARVVHGNSDTPEVREYLKSQNALLHFKCEAMWGEQFCGIGWLDEEGSRSIPEHFDVAGSILVTHAPPTKSADVDPKSKPAMHISGHMHSWEGEQERNGIRWVRISTFMHGRYALLTLPDQKVSFRSST